MGGAHKLIVNQLLEIASALVIRMDAIQNLLFPDRFYLLITAGWFESQKVARHSIIDIAFVGTEITQYSDGILAYGIGFSDESQLQFFVFLQLAISLCWRSFSSSLSSISIIKSLFISRCES